MVLEIIVSMFWFQMLIARGADLTAQNANGYASLKYSYSNAVNFNLAEDPIILWSVDLYLA